MGRDGFDVMMEFLWARIREDEVAAQALKPGKNQDVARLRERVLADVEVKRRLIGWVGEYPRIVQENQQPTLWRRARAELVAGLSRDLRSPVVMELLAPYRSHPDFHPGWLPVEDELRQESSS